MNNFYDDYDNGNSYVLHNKCKDLYDFAESDLHEDLRVFLEDRKRDFKLHNMMGLVLFNGYARMMNVKLTFSIGNNDFEFQKSRQQIHDANMRFTLW